MSTPPRPVAITAAGIVSPLGRGLPDTADSLLAARDCVSPVTRFDVAQCKSTTAGQVPECLLDPPKGRKAKRLHPASRMMLAAMGELREQDREFDPGFTVIATTSGGMSYGEAFWRSLPHAISPQPRWPHPRAAWLANYPPQKPVLDALEAAGFSTPCQIIANACASGTNAIGHAFSLIRAGIYKSVLCGGYDVISELVFVGFDSLQASTPEKCRPFDKDRTGLVLGEGAALLALEDLDSARARGAPILATVAGYGISTDNHHLTQPHPSGNGPYMAMSRALASARREPSEIDYINAHGTATVFNDATEGAAITRLFDRQVAVSSTKAMMGHSLGAAGAIEAIFCLLALREQFLPANIHFRAPDPAWKMEVIANEVRKAAPRCVLSNSFGFGGTNASIVLEKFSS
jgi:3-oxoacyl-[acyl-carrier-protein] synthase II